MRSLTPELLAQLYGQESNDPFLMLITVTTDTETLRFVNNTVDVTSRGDVYTAFPLEVTLPTDDGESDRVVTLSFDNVQLTLIDIIRTETNPIPVKIEMILASNPDLVQIEMVNLEIRTVSYNATTVTATLYLDDILNTELPSELYSPSTTPGIFH